VEILCINTLLTLFIGCDTLLYSDKNKQEELMMNDFMENGIFKISECRKIAVMGGTFNPIHYGHLVAAEAVRAEFGIERVLFIPTGRPPHKALSVVAPDEQRYLMTVLATAANPYFDVSRMEIDRKGTTYTIDTLRELKKICRPDAQIYFITGADAVNEIFTWREADKLLDMANFVAVTRPGYDKKRLEKNNSMYYLEIPALAISSTDIRDRVKAGKTIKYLLPESVEEYIIKFGLYKNDVAGELVRKIKERLSSVLTNKRYIHTLSTAREAAKLANIFGEDTSKAYIAGLLHDCAKDFSHKLRIEKCKEYNIYLDEVLKKQPDLIHSFLGGAVAEFEYGINDREILDAVKYHTTGRSNMTKLEKIIYLADLIEPERREFDGMKEIKNAAYSDLDYAMLLSLEGTIRVNRERGRLIHPLSIEAYNYYKSK